MVTGKSWGYSLTIDITRYSEHSVLEYCGSCLKFSLGALSGQPTRAITGNLRVNDLIRWGSVRQSVAVLLDSLQDPGLWLLDSNTDLIVPLPVPQKTLICQSRDRSRLPWYPGKFSQLSTTRGHRYRRVTRTNTIRLRALTYICIPGEILFHFYVKQNFESQKWTILEAL